MMIFSMTDPVVCGGLFLVVELLKTVENWWKPLKTVKIANNRQNFIKGPKNFTPAPSNFFSSKGSWPKGGGPKPHDGVWLYIHSGFCSTVLSKKHGDAPSVTRSFFESLNFLVKMWKKTVKKGQKSVKKGKSMLWNTIYWIFITKYFE